MYLFSIIAVTLKLSMAVMHGIQQTVGFAQPFDDVRDDSKYSTYTSNIMQNLPVTSVPPGTSEPGHHLIKETSEQAIDTESVLRCFMNKSVQTVSFPKSVHIHYSQNMDNRAKAGSNSTCVLHVLVPTGLLIHVRLVKQTCTSSNHVWFHDLGQSSVQSSPPQQMLTRKWTGCETVFDPLSDLLTTSNELMLGVDVGDVLADYSLRIHMEALKPPVTRPLEVRFLSPNLGLSLPPIFPLFFLFQSGLTSSRLVVGVSHFQYHQFTERVLVVQLIIIFMEGNHKYKFRSGSILVQLSKICRGPSITTIQITFSLMCI